MFVRKTELAKLAKHVQSQQFEIENLTEKLGIRGIPNLIILKGGAVKEQIVGAVPKAELVSAIENALL